MVWTDCSGNRIRESLLDGVTVTKATGGWNTKEACLYHRNMAILGGLLWIIMHYYGLWWIIRDYYGLLWIMMGLINDKPNKTSLEMGI